MNPVQREKWDARGLIILDCEQSLQLINYLCETDEWQEGITFVGEPAILLSIDSPGSKPKQSIVDKMKLNPSRAKELLGILQDNEEKLQQMVKEDEQEERRMLARACQIILSNDWGKNDGRIS